MMRRRIACFSVAVLLAVVLLAVPVLASDGSDGAVSIEVRYRSIVVVPDVEGARWMSALVVVVSYGLGIGAGISLGKMVLRYV